MAMGLYLSIITLNVNGLNAPTERQRLAEWIQNLENKMELQINRLETRIEKIQEMFNKDLEEIEKSQLIMNNAKLRSKALWRELTVE